MEIQGKEREREGWLGDSFRTGCKMHGRKDWTKESVSDCETWSQKPQFYDRKKYENCKYWLLHKRHSIPHSRDSQCHSARVVVVGVGWLATIHPSIQCGIQAKTPQIIIFLLQAVARKKIAYTSRRFDGSTNCCYSSSSSSTVQAFIITNQQLLLLRPCVLLSRNLNTDRAAGGRLRLFLLDYFNEWVAKNGRSLTHISRITRMVRSTDSAFRDKETAE